MKTIKLTKNYAIKCDGMTHYGQTLAGEIVSADRCTCSLAAKIMHIATPSERAIIEISKYL